MSSLVIVESPAKARTLSRILGSGYDVEASGGHIRDLPNNADEIPAAVKGEPWARLGVNVDNRFEPVYVIPENKKRYVTQLKKALEKADEILLAADEDREGESICWHVIEELQPRVPVRRIVFHEITDEAIHSALKSPRDIDTNLVRAQESRRIIDRLFGYELSPVLWKRVASGLSAGRVQSVAVRLCVLRERERRRFRSASYWGVEATLDKDGASFVARLVSVDDQKLANRQSFDPETGELKAGSKALWLRSEAETRALIDGWGSDWTVDSVEEKEQKRQPAPPFTTSSMQQEANRKLRFTAKRTMSIAQRLYEGIEIGAERVGLITYMRTDSTTLANRALAEAQQLIQSRYGKAYAAGPRRYRATSKGAQEAHEAIRPTKLSRTPEELRSILSDEELKLYELIWRRTIASQMANARLHRTIVELTAPAEDGPDGRFSVTGTRIEFDGFLRVYHEDSDDPRRQDQDQEVILPHLARGMSCRALAVDPKGTETAPPARYTEASLVKKLEAEGIGRPSTYATILDTIQRRGYVFKRGNALVPTFTAHAVTLLLERHFEAYVDTAFTARMEQRLDDIASGELDWLELLQRFYDGSGPEQPGLKARIEEEEPQIEYPSMEIGNLPDGQPIAVRIGRFGPYLQAGDESGSRITASIPEDTPPADLTLEAAIELLQRAEKGGESLGTDPESGLPVLLRHGRYGAYVQLGETPEDKSAPKPRSASVPKGIADHDVGLEDALKWLSLPRVLGRHPESEEEVIARTGRYGPYIQAGKETRSLGKDDDIYEIGLDRALELLAQPKQRGRQSAAPLRELGKDKDGNEVRLMDGRWGPYLTNGEKNASLRKGEDPDKLTPEQAIAILGERGKAPKRRRKR